MKKPSEYDPINFKEIEKIFGGHFENDSEEKPEWFLESSQLSLEDQKWIWEQDWNDQETTKEKKEANNENVSVNGNENGTCYSQTNSELTQSKQQHKRQILTELKKCSYRTSPKKIASLLKKLLADSETKPGHWLFIAQAWTPRAINWTLVDMIKQHQSGRTVIEKPAAYFTYLIKFRKRRKRKIVSTNGAC